MTYVRKSHRRLGVAAVWALVVVAVVSALSMAAVAQFASARRQADQNHHRLQAEWLARAGYELAVARLLAEPTGYTGETVTPVPGGEVKIAVREDPEKKGAYRVECEARFPVDGRGLVVSRLDRVVRRTESPKGIRIERVATDAAGK